jgi:beta-alanine--pyruvate transaminase
MDAMATLWCVNAGPCRPRIVEAIARQAGTLDYCSSYSIRHPVAFEAAHRVAAIAPAGMKHVFFVNSGSESVDTALKISLAYHRLRGAATRTRFIGRERGFHGANIGGMSVGGVPAYRKAFGAALLPQVDHLRHTQDLATRAFVRGQSDTGAELADELEHRIIPLHDAINIAAVIVEPVAGAGGVLVPPQGYLKRLREICDRHGILLIFDEVITGFGRLGAPFASQFFGVVPDMITFAKGITSGTVPMGGVLVRDVYRTFIGRRAAASSSSRLYLLGHPLASAAALGTLDTYAGRAVRPRANQAFRRRRDLRGLPNVIDCRNLQFIGAVELAPRPGAPGARGLEVHNGAWDRGVFVRAMGDTIAFCPPLIVEKPHLDTMFGVVAETLRAVA